MENENLQENLLEDGSSESIKESTQEVNQMVMVNDPELLQKLVDNTAQTNAYLFILLVVGGVIIIWHWISYAFKDYF